MSLSSYIRRQFKNNVSVNITIPAGLNGTATSAVVNDGSTMPSGATPWICCVDQGLSTEEKILVDSRSGNTLTFDVAGRGYSNTTAQSHVAGCSILHTIDPQDMDEANYAVTQTVGAVSAAGDLLVGASTNTLARLAKGATTTFLQAGASTLSWVGFGSGRSQLIGSTVGDGTDTTPARSDHVHALAATDTTTTKFSNKRIVRRVVAVTQSATPIINTDNTDVASITALAQAITSMSSSLSGTPSDGDLLEIRIKDNGTSRAITWGASFASSSSTTLPTSTNPSELLSIQFEWDAADAVWYCIDGAPINYLAGNLSGSNFTQTTSFSTFLTTASFPVGTWLVTLKADNRISAAGISSDIQVAAGTATASFQGATLASSNVGGTSAVGTNSCVLQFIAVVTVAGTLVFQARASALTSAFIDFASLVAGSTGVTGYTAIRLG
jgi:hypothetical protein